MTPAPITPESLREAGFDLTHPNLGQGMCIDFYRILRVRHVGDHWYASASSTVDTDYFESKIVANMQEVAALVAALKGNE